LISTNGRKISRARVSWLGAVRICENLMAALREPVPMEVDGDTSSIVSAASRIGKL